MKDLAWMDLIEDVSPDPASPEAILKLKQDLTFSNLQSFQAFVRMRLKDGKTTLRLDFGSVKFIDSAGVGALAQFHKQTRAAGGELVLLNANQTVRSILKIVGMDKIVRMEDAELPTSSRPSIPRPAPTIEAKPPSSMHGVQSELAEGEVDQETDDAVSRLLLKEVTVDRGASSPTHVTPAALTIHLKENITYRNAPTVDDGFVSYLRKGVRTLRVDMSRVDFVDSAGVAALLKVSRAFQDEGGTLILLAPSPNLQRILKIAKLDRVMTIEQSPER